MAGRARKDREAKCLALERKHVHDVYASTAHHFQDARYKAWPQVKQFLQDLEPGSLVADIGCGTGKYMHINKNIMKLGSDYCPQLTNIAHLRKHEVMICDNLTLPYRDSAFDAVISIGVIHHLTTGSRRAKAVQEIARVLRPGGKVMIYVWAMEQNKRQFDGQDVLVPWHLQPKQHKKAKDKSRRRYSQERPANTSDDEGNHQNCNNNQVETSPGSTRVNKKKRNKLERGKALKYDDGSLDVDSSMEQDPDLSKPIVSKAAAIQPQLSEAKGEAASFHEDDTNNEAPKSPSIPDLLKNRFKSFFGSFGSKPPVEQEAKQSLRRLTVLGNLKTASNRQKDEDYKKLIDDIVSSHADILAEMSRPTLEHSHSTPESELEMFQVREFPQSSQQALQRQASDSMIESQSRRNSVIQTSIDLSSRKPSVSSAPKEGFYISTCDDDEPNKEQCIVNSNVDINPGAIHSSHKSHPSEVTNGSKETVTENGALIEDSIAKDTSPHAQNNVNNSQDIDTEEGFTSEQEPLSVPASCLMKPVYPNSESDFVKKNYNIDTQTKKYDYSDFKHCDTSTRIAINKLNNLYDAKANDPQMAQVCAELNTLFEHEQKTSPADPHEDSSSPTDQLAMMNKQNSSQLHVPSARSSGDSGCISPDTSDSTDNTPMAQDSGSSPNLPKPSFKEGNIIPNEESDSDEWRKITAQAINTMQSQVMKSSEKGKTIPIHCNGHYKKTHRHARARALIASKKQRDNQVKATENHDTTSEHASCPTCTRLRRDDTIDTKQSPKKTVLGKRLSLKLVEQSSISSDAYSESSSDVDDSGICTCVCEDDQPILPERPPMEPKVESKEMLPSDGKPEKPAVDEVEHTPNGSQGESLTDQEANMFKRFYHVFKEGELVKLIEKNVPCLHVIEAYYDHANWCVVAEKVNVWTI